MARLNVGDPFVERTLRITSTGQLGKGAYLLFGKDDKEVLHSAVVRYKRLHRHPVKEEIWRLRGTWDQNPKYTNQIIVSDGEPVPVKGELMRRLITHHSALRVGRYPRSIGEQTWVKAIEKAGGPDELANLLTQQNTIILKSFGIGRLSVNLPLVYDAWSQLKGELDSVEFLQTHQFDKALAGRLLRYYGERTGVMLADNAFLPLAFQKNTKALWNLCNRMADQLEYAADDERRLLGVIDFICNWRMDDKGHTAIAPETLRTALIRQLGNAELADKAINLALERNALQKTPEGLYQSRPVAQAETEVELALESLIRANKVQDSALAERAREILPSVRITDNDGKPHQLKGNQPDAVLLPFLSRFSLVTGGAGTGKTAVVSCIQQVAQQLNIPVYQMALAGKAADVMRDNNVLGQLSGEAHTLHWYLRQLEDTGDEDDKGKQTEPFEFGHDPLIIVDEASMVNLILWCRLFGVLPEQFRLVMVGDHNQLRPVGPGLVFHRLCPTDEEVAHGRCQVAPRCHLTEVHRSAAETGIPQMGELICQGTVPKLPIFPDTSTPSVGVYFMPVGIDANDPYCLARPVHEVAARLGYENTQVITAFSKGRDRRGRLIPDAAQWINERFQHSVTDTHQTAAGKALRARWGLNVGDPILVRKNVFNVLERLNGPELNLFNGNLGRLSQLQPDGHTISCEFGHGERKFTVELGNPEIAALGLKPGYGLTTHSFQGSGKDNIIATITNSPLIDRSLIYTALTRAKKLCVFIGDQRAFYAAVQAPPTWQTLTVGFDLDRYFHESPAKA